MTTQPSPAANSPLTSKFDVEVIFLSDWSIGTGRGRHAGVDRTVRRDEDGLPMLPGKTLGPMLRDAAETVARAFDEAADGPWHEWVRWLFGPEHPAQGAATTTDTSGARAVLQPRPLRLAAPLRERLTAHTDRGLLTAATVVLRPGVELDPDTSVATEDSLRLEERARLGFRLQATWTLDLDDTPGQPDGVPWQAEVLLRSAATLTDHVGGKRRRGAGRCAVLLPGALLGDDGQVDDPLLVALLDAHNGDVADPGAPTARTRRQAPDVLGAPDGATLRHVADLRLTTLTSLLIARSTQANTVQTDDVVRGSSLLPLLTRALGPDGQRAITAGHAAVTDATMELAGRRALPVPRCLQSPKRAPAVTQLANLVRAPGDPSIRWRPAVGWIVPGQAPTAPARWSKEGPAKREVAHPAVDDDSQRPQDGGLFVYQAIAPGTVLRAEIWLAADLPFDPAPLTGQHAIGRSSKDDYGLVNIDVLPVPTDADAAAGVPAGPATVWLTSDALLDDTATAAASPTPAALAAALHRVLGVAVTLPKRSANDPQASAFVIATRRESWHTRWGLPRPSLIGLQAGSVVEVELGAPVDAETVQAAQSRGLGDRRAEGFGRFLLAPPLLAEPLVDLADPGDAAGSVAASPLDSPSTATDLLAADAEVLRNVEDAAWRPEVRRLAVEVGTSPARHKWFPGLTSTQCGLLRSLVAAIQRDGTLDVLLRWSAGIPAARRNDWKAIDATVNALAKNPTSVWQLLSPPVQPPAEVAERLAVEAVGHLLAQVARAAVADARSEQARRPGGPR